MLESALGWVGEIARAIGKWVPRRRILDTTEGAIKYKGGSKIVFCGPGIHWYWPAYSTFVEAPTALQTDRLETQTMETEDGITFIVSGTVTYEVVDLTKLIPCTHSPLTLVTNNSMSAVHDVCCDMPWAQLQLEQRKGTIKTKLRNEAQKQLGEFGIKVHKLQLNTLARARVYKISQSTSTEEN